MKKKSSHIKHIPKNAHFFTVNDSFPVDEAKAEFQKVLNWTELVDRRRLKIENLQEEVALSLVELKEKIRIAREEANNVSAVSGVSVARACASDGVTIFFALFSFAD